MKTEPRTTRLESIPHDGCWQNSLGMTFVRVPGTEVLFCVWLTRVMDYESYWKAKPELDESWKKKKRFTGFPYARGPTIRSTASPGRMPRDSATG